MLEATDLTKTYVTAQGPWRAVDNVSFRIEEGEFFTLLGPSGCGKTTTLRCVAGLEMPDAGRIAIGAQPVFDGAARLAVPANRRDLGMVFQSYAVWPHMTVLRNVSFPLEVHGASRAEAEAGARKALGLVGLAHLADRPATLLSGGQQQRVALARAIVRPVRLLLFDEPLSNLDAELRVQMRAELRDLQQRLRATSVYVTHDQEEAMGLSDRIAVMRAGRIVEVGTPDALYLRPRHPFTARFVGQAELMPARVLSRDGGAALVDTPVGTLSAADSLVEAGQEAGLLVRPEHVELLDGGAAPATNTLDGRVLSVAFLGKLADHEVAVAGHRLRVQTLSTARRRVGDAVRVHLPPARCIVLPVDAGR
ncbi:MAG: ABC transporter ATP-binding protein [Acetobacteraceae bacterium]|nr:ABC transporter ATP-binding protein [Acetobacteraceae bacterium]